MKLWLDDILGSNVIAKLGEVWSWRYLLLLMRSWNESTPCFIENSDDVLLRYMSAPASDRMSAEFEWVKAKFTPTADGKFLYNEKQLSVFRESEAEYLKRSSRAKKGAEARWKPAIIAKDAPVPASIEAFNACEAARGLMQMLGLAGQQWMRDLTEVVDQAAKFWDCEPQLAADRLAASWNAYQQGGDKYKVGVGRFFRDGKWKDGAEVKPRRRYLNA